MKRGLALLVTVAITGADGMRVELVTNGNGNFKSVTRSSATLSGQRQRVAPLTKATPIRHDTRLRSVASFTAS